MVQEQFNRYAESRRQIDADQALEVARAEGAAAVRHARLMREAADAFIREFGDLGRID